MTRSATRSHAIACSVAIVLVVAACGTSDRSPSPTPVAAATPLRTTTAPTVAPTPVSPAPEPTSAPIPRNPAGLDEASPFAPIIDPADFVDVIDHPYWPLAPGASFVFAGGGEEIRVEVTHERRTVMGVSTIVVHDQVIADGELLEDTYDWYAQDRAGNVWYFGEATLSYEHGPAGDPAGSWEAGVDGAQPGIVMLADPRHGDAYRQEYLRGEAEDVALVRHVEPTITVPAGTFRNVLVIEEWTPLMPEVIELKYYAVGAGMILERAIFGGEDVVELTAMSGG